MEGRTHPSREGICCSPPRRPVLSGVEGGGHRPGCAAWWRFLRNKCGAAALESVIGAVVLVTTSVLSLNLYTQVSATATGLNVAVTVADYVSREANPRKSEMAALATFLHDKFFPQADATFVVVAVQGATGKNLKWKWTKQIFVDSSAGTDPDLAKCSKVAGKKKKATPPDALGLKKDEIVIVAEVCVKHTGGVSYYHHILPTRFDTVPNRPS